MNLVCLDSMYFVWGVLRRPNPGQVNMVESAEKFFDHLDKTGATIVVPTPLLQELLMESDPSELQVIMTTLSGNFHIAEYDADCARLAATIWNIRKRQGVIGELREKGGSIRTKMKIDLQILATAISTRCSTLYTNDRDLAKMADGLIVVADMPEFSEQLLMELWPADTSTSQGALPPFLKSPPAMRTRRGIELSPEAPSIQSVPPTAMPALSPFSTDEEE